MNERTNERSDANDGDGDDDGGELLVIIMMISVPFSD